MDVLIEVCSRARLNPATHALLIPSDSADQAGPDSTFEGGAVGSTQGGTVPFTASQSLQSLGVSAVRVVAKSQAVKSDHRLCGQLAASSQPFEVLKLHRCATVAHMTCSSLFTNKSKKVKVK